MQYGLFIYEDEAKARAENGRTPMMAEHMAFAGDLRAKGQMTGGAGLKTSSAATTLRNAGGNRTIHDGPFAEGKEQLGGFYLIEVPDLDAAIAVARRVPLFEGGAVEIRPLLEPPPAA